MDQNLLMAMVAPRGLLMASAYSEGQGAPFGFEQAFRSVQTVYRFVDAESKLGLSLRPGEHATTAEDIEQYVDFFDSVFGRSTRPVPRTQLLPVAPQVSERTAPAKNAPLRDRALWLLGERPPGLPFPARRAVQGRTMTSDGWLGMMFQRPVNGKGFKAVAVGFGDDLKGDLYLPEQVAVKLPVVIWLHPYAHATGYSRNIRPTLEALTGLGYAVFCFDQIGFGSRIHQATRFYDRYPQWSLLGKMIDDTSAAVESLASMPELDASRIYVAGYSLGGKVAIWTAALDSRVAGVIAASAFTPLRTPDTSTEGLDHYTSLHALLPRLARFRNAQASIPVDYDELLAAIAPRPVYVRAPMLDRDASHQEVRKAAAGSHITLSTPLDFNRFGAAAQKEAFSWLAGLR